MDILRYISGGEPDHSCAGCSHGLAGCFCSNEELQNIIRSSGGFHVASYSSTGKHVFFLKEKSDIDDFETSKWTTEGLALPLWQTCAFAPQFLISSTSTVAFSMYRYFLVFLRLPNRFSCASSTGCIPA